jgi:hypothetical protein
LLARLYTVENMYPNFSIVTNPDSGEVVNGCATDGGVCNYRAVFVIVFPAVTGIMEGANLR